MAAPTPTVRITPPGIMLEEGHQALITFLADPNIDLWEKQVTPPAFDNGDKVDTSTQHNSVFTTSAPSSLIEVGDSQFTCGYDPVAYNQIKAICGVRTVVTVRFPDGSTLCFYGYLKSFTPGPLAEGQPVEATVVVVCTNWDYNNNVEAGPVMTEVAGT